MDPGKYIYHENQVIYIVLKNKIENYDNSCNKKC